MGDKIRTAIEIAMEKAAMLDDLSPEEKEALENKKKLEPLMAGFYGGKIKPEELWKKLKGEKPSLFKETQLNLIDSIKFKLTQEEFQKRKRALLAIESLKKEQKTSIIEQGLNLLENLQKKSDAEKKQAFNEFKKAVEKNPQARTRVIEQGDAKIIARLSPEEAVMQNPQWKQFLIEFDQNYEQEFVRIIEQLKMEIL
jgi:hypothetical protein